MSQHAVDLLRKYAEIVNEAEQPQQQAVPPQAVQKAGQKLAQSLSPEEAEQLKSIVDQVGKNPQAIAKAVGVTKQDLQSVVSEDFALEEGIQPTLKGKILQALHLATVGVGIATIPGVSSLSNLPGSELISMIGMVALAASAAFWDTSKGHRS